MEFDRKTSVTRNPPLFKNIPFISDSGLYGIYEMGVLELIEVSYHNFYIAIKTIFGTLILT